MKYLSSLLFQRVNPITLLSFAGTVASLLLLALMFIEVTR